MMRKTLAERFPQYQPVVEMAEHAFELSRIAKSADDDRDAHMAAVTAHDKVAAFLMPRLKAVEHSGEVRTSVVLFKSDEEL